MAGRGTANAQTPPPRVELGGGLTSMLFEGLAGFTHPVGPSVRVTFGLTPRLAIEARTTYLPQKQLSEYQFQGGRTWVVLAGPRGTLASTKRLSIVGSLLAGTVHFSESYGPVFATADPTVIDSRLGPLTHFMFDLGLGVVIRATPRVSFRAEVNSDIYTGPSSVVIGPREGDHALGAGLQGGFRSTSQLNVGVSYGFGRIAEMPTNASTIPAAQRGTVGVQATYRVAAPVLPLDMLHSYGISTFATYPLGRHFDLDAAFSRFADPHAPASPFDGRGTMQFLGGVRWGGRSGPVGVFVKVRPGASRLSGVLVAQDSNLGPTFGSRTDVAVDVGGVLELYLPHRLLMRLDAGDVATVFHAAPYSIDGVATRLPVDPFAPRVDSIYLAIGVGWRY